MRVLANFVCTVFGGLIVGGILSFLALAGLEALGTPSGVNGIILMLLLPASFVLAGWGSSRAFPKKALPARAEAKKGPRERLAPIGIGIAGLVIIIAGINLLEYRAEAKAKGFCDPALVGSPIATVAEAAKGMGTDLLRRIEPDSVRVGFTGLPPFSRHMCTVEGQRGLVTNVKYSYLD